MQVEGANTLTRSLIQFGQGLMRAHPHLLSIVRAVQKGDDMKVPTPWLQHLMVYECRNGVCGTASCVEAQKATA